MRGEIPTNFVVDRAGITPTNAWWEMVLTGEDLLRQRIALALTEILVISKQNSDLENFGYGLASFYDICIRRAFGNYRDILMEVALHPAMGNYLSHLNNPRSNPVEFTFPDENFGREVMQLFTVGIHELNNDGTRRSSIIALDFVQFRTILYPRRYQIVEYQ